MASEAKDLLTDDLQANDVWKPTSAPEERSRLAAGANAKHGISLLGLSTCCMFSMHEYDCLVASKCIRLQCAAIRPHTVRCAFSGYLISDHYLHLPYHIYLYSISLDITPDIIPRFLPVAWYTKLKMKSTGVMVL
jgi:hypothetical protein